MLPIMSTTDANGPGSSTRFGRKSLVDALGVLVVAAGGPTGLHWRRRGWREWRLYRGDELVGTARHVESAEQPSAMIELAPHWAMRWA